MSFSLYWTDEAQVTFDSIVRFIEEIWGEKEAGIHQKNDESIG